MQRYHFLIPTISTGNPDLIHLNQMTMNEFRSWFEQSRSNEFLCKIFDENSYIRIISMGHRTTSEYIKYMLYWNDEKLNKELI